MTWFLIYALRIVQFGVKHVILMERVLLVLQTQYIIGKMIQQITVPVI